MKDAHETVKPNRKRDSENRNGNRNKVNNDIQIHGQ
jgi:hypothetical protein